jgi:hypothetical protein
MYRRTRRNKLRYRKPRFLNRKRSENWLPPSIERKYQSHLVLIKKLKYILPIKDIIIEVGNFDIQKLINPEVSGIDYQQGNLYNYSNLKSFVMCREKGICQLCNTNKKDKFVLHHIISRSNLGTDRPDNLALLHDSCHKRLHKCNLQNRLKKNKQYKESTFMNIIKNRFKVDLDCKLTFGYETFVNRNNLNLEKSHSNDAFVIAKGTTQTRSIEYIVRQKRKNNRSLQLNRKGFKPSIRRQRYKLQPQDLVKIDRNSYRVLGIFNYGKWVRLKDNMDKILNVKIDKIDSSFYEKTFIWN